MANNFTNDDRCVALWRFESGALTIDSKGSNTLTNVGVAEDAVIFNEGSGSGSYPDGASKRYLYINDGDLGTGFPLKSGDTIKQGTWCFRFRATGISGYQDLLAKSEWLANRGLSIGLINSVVLSVQWSSGSTVTEYSIGTVAVNKWYHVAIVFDGVNKTLYGKIYNITDDTYEETTAKPNYELGAPNCPFAIGRYWPNDNWNWFIGNIDEVVIFNDLLSPTEIDQIRQGVFGAQPLTTPGRLKIYIDGEWKYAGKGISGYSGYSGFTGNSIVDDTTPQLGNNLDMNDNNIIHSIPGTDLLSNGFIISATVDTNEEGVGAPLFMSADGNFDTAAASADTIAPCVAMALEEGTGTKKVLLQGVIRNDSWDWTIGPGISSLIYLGVTTGTLTQIQPSDTDNIIQIVGFALSADVIYFSPQYHYITHA